MATQRYKGVMGKSVVDIDDEKNRIDIYFREQGSLFSSSDRGTGQHGHIVLVEDKSVYVRNEGGKTEVLKDVKTTVPDPSSKSTG